ncbi:MAG: hypothetical protein WBA89_05325 [Microcoleus sp.]
MPDAFRPDARCPMLLGPREHLIFLRKAIYSGRLHRNNKIESYRQQSTVNSQHHLTV